MRIPSAVVPFSFLMFAGCAAAPEVDLERERAAVTARSQAVAAAEAAKNAEQAITFWADDAIVQPAGAPQIQGRAAILDFYGQFMTDELKEFAGTSTQVIVAESGDLAWEQGTTRFVVATPNGDVVDIGKYLAVWKKIDNEWYIAALSFSSDAMPPAAAPSN
jgi:ketosteroid isomerase-like protein